MGNQKIFNTGEKYSIKYFFSGENDKINIPDLQRDYCWGGKGRLVENFVESLLEFCGIKQSNLMSEAPVDSCVPMGLIYGYFDEGLYSHLQLCDGQQRMTTLFLILGVLNRLIDTPTSEIKDRLMSNFEFEHDDHEPYLRYGIRESSLYFLSDLTYHYFINKENSLSGKIQDCNWYLHEYDYDPTITSIIAAVESIKNTISTNNLTEKQLITFAQKISEIKFLYYDMGNREDGEKTFVIINTTGEPLSPTQNLKPIIINQAAPITSTDPEIRRRRSYVSEKWEEMETWFWTNRSDGEETADNGMNCFFHALWFYNSKNREEAFTRYEWNDVTIKEVCKIPFDDIYQMFLYYSRIKPLLDSCLIDGGSCEPYKLTARQLYVIIPILKYLEKWPDASDIQLYREFHIFSNMTLYRTFDRDSRSVTAPAYRAKSIVEDQSGIDTLSLIEKGFDRNDDFMIEERTKLEFIRDNIDQRDSVESSLWNAEKMKVFNGQIKEIIIKSTDLVHFQVLIARYSSLFSERAETGDLQRRAFLAQNFVPSEGEFWSSIESIRELAHNPEFVNWIDSFELNDILPDMENIVNAYDDKNNPYFLIITEPKYLAFSTYKRYNKYVGDLIELRKKNNNMSSNKYIYYQDSVDKDLQLSKISILKVCYNENNRISIWSELKDYNLWLELILSENRIICHDNYYPDRPLVPIELMQKINNYITQNTHSHEKPLTWFKNLLIYIDNLLNDIID